MALPATPGANASEESKRQQFAFSDLYVMQAECSLIKVGRSTNPERRRVELLRLVNQRVELVLVLDGRGQDEDRVLKGMQRKGFPRILPPEWFIGNEDNKARLTKLLGAKISKWPFRNVGDRSSLMIERLQGLALRSHLQRRRTRVIADIRCGDIYKYLDRSGPNGLVRQAISHEFCILMIRGEMVVGRRYHEPIADYLGDVEVARTIGPPGWTYPEGGTAEETVIAALQVLTKWENELAREN